MGQFTPSIIKDEILGKNLAFWEKKKKLLLQARLNCWVSLYLSPRMPYGKTEFSLQTNVSYFFTAQPNLLD